MGIILDYIEPEKLDNICSNDANDIKTFSAIAHDDDILQTYLKEIGKIKLLK